LQAIANGWELVPTDKNYKVYIKVPNPDAGKVVKMGSRVGPAREFEDATFDELDKGRAERPIMGTAPPTEQRKFYWQHLNEEEKHRFISAWNEGTLKIAYPGHFYNPPYFVRLTAKENTA
jgi:hypothetical protein